MKDLANSNMIDLNTLKTCLEFNLLVSANIIKDEAAHQKRIVKINTGRLLFIVHKILNLCAYFRTLPFFKACTHTNIHKYTHNTLHACKQICIHTYKNNHTYIYTAYIYTYIHIYFTVDRK